MCRGGPFVFPRVTFSLWRELYGHLCSMLRRLLDWWCVDRPLQALGRPGVHSNNQKGIELTSFGLKMLRDLFDI